MESPLLSGSDTLSAGAACVDVLSRLSRVACGADVAHYALADDEAAAVLDDKAAAQEAADGCVARRLQPQQRGDDDDADTLLRVHARHRRRLYVHHARRLAHVSDTHAHYEFMMWCHAQQLFVHPAVRVTRATSAYRDHAFCVAEDVPALTPLLAIPESLLIGFADVADEDARAMRNALYDAERERQFNMHNSGGGSDGTPAAAATAASSSSPSSSSSDAADVCAFFFASLGTLVADLVTARHSPLSDVRHCFARALTRVRTLHNAPYLGDDVVFDAREPCLADVVLQMIRNYINGGPLVNKVPREELQWAVSVCLSHATPLVIGAVHSIGLVPFVHLFPHGGQATNAFVVARTTHADAAARMAARLCGVSGYNFAQLNGGHCVYVVTARPLRAGEAVLLQAMAPVCDRDDDVAAAQMWQLSCGSAPSDYMRSADVAARQAELTRQLLAR